MALTIPWLRQKTQENPAQTSERKSLGSYVSGALQSVANTYNTVKDKVVEYRTGVKTEDRKSIESAHNQAFSNYAQKQIDNLFNTGGISRDSEKGKDILTKMNKALQSERNYQAFMKTYDNETSRSVVDAVKDLKAKKDQEATALREDLETVKQRAQIESRQAKILKAQKLQQFQKEYLGEARQLIECHGFDYNSSINELTAALAQYNRGGQNLDKVDDKFVDKYGYLISLIQVARDDAQARYDDYLREGLKRDIQKTFSEQSTRQQTNVTHLGAYRQSKTDKKPTKWTSVASVALIVGGLGLILTGCFADRQAQNKYPTPGDLQVKPVYAQGSMPTLSPSPASSPGASPLPEQRPRAPSRTRPNSGASASPTPRTTSQTPTNPEAQSATIDLVYKNGEKTVINAYPGSKIVLNIGIGPKKAIEEDKVRWVGRGWLKTSTGNKWSMSNYSNRAETEGYTILTYTKRDGSIETFTIKKGRAYKGEFPNLEEIK